MHASSLYVEKLSYIAGYSFIIEDLNFILEQGQCLVLTGANGSGKSTTLRILAGLIRPCQGRVLLGGCDIHRTGVQSRHFLGLLPEKLPLYPALTVRAYLSFISILRALPANQQGTAVDRALEDLRLQAYASIPIHQLSQGLQQRVGLAQAILHRPRVLLLDEPTNSLDPGEVQHFQTLLADLKPSTAIVVSTHHLGEVLSLCDHHIILSHQGIHHHDLQPCTA